MAEAIHVPYQRVNELVNRKRGVTPGTALRLAQFFGTSAAFWLNLQLRWDLYHASIAEAAELKRIKRLRPLAQRLSVTDGCAGGDSIGRVLTLPPPAEAVP